MSESSESIFCHCFGKSCPDCPSDFETESDDPQNKLTKSVDENKNITMSNPKPIEIVKKTSDSSGDAADQRVIASDNLSVPANFSFPPENSKDSLDSKETEDSSNKCSSYFFESSVVSTNDSKSQTVWAEGKLGRAISQPVEPEELRRFGANFDDDDIPNGHVPLSALARRTQLKTRRRQNRSLYGVSPHCKFGPKGFLSSGSSYSLTIPDPNNQKLNWTKPPLTVLIIRKHLDETVLIPFRDLVVWLVKEKNMVLYVEQAVMEEQILSEDEGFQSVQEKLKAFKEDDDLTDKIDFIICLGGDGTLLYASTLFQSSVPPVMAFNMGSLGFLTPFQFYQDFKQEVSRVMQGSASLLLRYRLKCVVVRHDKDTEADIPHVKNIHKEHRSLKTHKLVLNEVVVDRGSSSYLSNLDLYIEGRRVTSVQGDGLIISTPTGSTAYAVAAGASMIHPSVPCILLTPICPHSLSFRPVVVPAGVEIKIVLSPGARGTAMVSFDGRDRIEIHQGDSLRITTASYPVPSVCAADQIEDWFDGLAVCLNWNLRQQQRPLQSTNSLTSIDSFDLIQ